MWHVSADDGQQGLVENELLEPVDMQSCKGGISMPCPVMIASIIERGRRTCDVVGEASTSSDDDTMPNGSTQPSKRLASVAQIGPVGIESCSHCGKLEERKGEFRRTL